jgi:hypothetical protein
MVIVLLLVNILYNLFTRRYKEYGINKTVGWAWNITDFSPIIFLLSFYLFLMVYGIIALSKRKTNFNFSILHLIIIIGSLILLEKNEKGYLMIFNLLSLIVFFINLYKSLKKE